MKSMLKPNQLSRWSFEADAVKGTHCVDGIATVRFYLCPAEARHIQVGLKPPLEVYGLAVPWADVNDIYPGLHGTESQHRDCRFHKGISLFESQAI